MNRCKEHHKKLLDYAPPTGTAAQRRSEFQLLNECVEKFLIYQLEKEAQMASRKKLKEYKASAKKIYDLRDHAKYLSELSQDDPYVLPIDVERRYEDASNDLNRL